MSILDDLLGGQQPTAPPPETPAPTPTALPQPQETPRQENILDTLIAQSPAPVQDIGTSVTPTGGEIAADVAKSAAIGVPKGLIAGAGTPGAIRELASAGTEYAGSLLGYTPEQINKFKEYASKASQFNPMARLLSVAPTPADIRKAIEEKTGKFYEPKTGYGQIAEAGTEFLANPVSYLGPGSMGLKAATALGMGIGSESAGQVAEYYGGEGLPADAARFAGAVISGAIKLPQRVVNARFNRMLDGATSTEELLDTADSMYDLSRHSGVQLRSDALRNISVDVEKALKADGFNEVTAGGTIKTLTDVIPDLTNNLGYVGVKELQTARKALSKVANTKSPDLAADREAARYAIAEINKYAASTPIKDLVAGTPQMLSEATQAWKMADKAYSAGMRAKQLEEALQKAITDTAQTGKGGNLENNMRKAVGRIAESKVKSRGFTDDELDLMKEIARGTKGRNALRKLSALAPTGIVSGGIGLEIGHLLFSGAFHGLGAVIPGTVGAAAKRMAESRTERRIQDLISGVRLRGTNLTPPTRPEQAWMTPPLSTLYTAPGAVNPQQPTFARGGRVHKKLDHKSVDYVARSRRQEHCAACSMFIAKNKGGPACTLVKSPINPAGWCRRFVKKKLNMADGGNVGDASEWENLPHTPEGIPQITVPPPQNPMMTQGMGDIVRGVGSALVSPITDAYKLATGKVMPEEVPWTTAMALGSLIGPPGEAQAVGAAERVAPKFYSALEQAVGKIPQARMPAEQWMGTLANKPGVRPDELAWTGLQDFLTTKKGQPVSKQEMLDYLTNNKIMVQEVTKGTTHNYPYVSAEDWETAINEAEVRGDWPEVHRLTQAQEGLNAETGSTAGQPKFSQWQLSGATNYREKLLTLPTKTSPKAAEAFELTRRMQNGEFNSLDDTSRRALFEKRDQLLRDARAEEGQTFKSSHWDEPNVLAHYRMNDRMVEAPGDNAPKESLHLEELQSDWHQKGRKEGYAAKRTGQDAWQYLRARGIDTSGWSIERAAHEAGELGWGRGVPDAPFKKNWHELALKSAVRDAIESGKDRVSWTPGEAQAERYDLSKYISHIDVDPEGDAKRVVLHARSGVAASGLVDKTGKIIQGYDAFRDAVNKPLSDVIGKEMADKILKTRYITTYAGEDLKIGGEGMKGFYDQILPKAAEKIFKEYGVKVKKGNVPSDKYAPYSISPLGEHWAIQDRHGTMVDQLATKEAANRTLNELNTKAEKAPVWYFDIPQALKNASLQKGHPLFARGGRVLASNINHRPTEAQKEAGNYAKDHIHIHGLDIAIENAKGQYRHGIKGGKPWRVKMPAHYGYIKGTVGKDKDHVDVYVGPDTRSSRVFVIDQKNAETGKFDEHKSFLGFASKAQVINAYHKAFSDGKADRRLGHIAEMSVAEFKHWLINGNTTRPTKQHPRSLSAIQAVLKATRKT